MYERSKRVNNKIRTLKYSFMSEDVLTRKMNARSIIEDQFYLAAKCKSLHFKILNFHNGNTVKSIPE